MTTGGWILIILAWGVIFSLLIFCYSRVLKGDEAIPEYHYEGHEID